MKKKQRRRWAHKHFFNRGAKNFYGLQYSKNR